MRLFISLLILFVLIIAPASADNFEGEIAAVDDVSSEEQKQGLADPTGNSTDGETKAAAELLRIDAKYQEMKAIQAGGLFHLAQERFRNAPERPMSARYAALFDAVATAQTVQAHWLSSQERNEFLAWYSMAGREVALLSEKMDAPGAVAGTQDAMVDEEATLIISVVSNIKAALAKANEENLSIIKNAKPNKRIQECLEECERARELLFSMTENPLAFSQEEWDEAIVQLRETILTLKIRQQIKYTLWAEGLYRESMQQEPKTNEAAMFSYEKLGEIDLSITLEPSLAREITTRMYELYDRVTTTEDKAQLRYQSIMQLKERKTLYDF